MDDPAALTVAQRQASAWQRWTAQGGASRAFGRSPLWLAAYRSTPPVPVGGWPAWSLWQYTASASVPGICVPIQSSA